MPISAAARTGITRWSAEADPFNRTQTDADHALLDDLVAIDLHDAALAARPAFGTRGRYFTESAASAGLPGTTWREDGTAWRALGSRVLSTGTGDVAQVVAGVTGQSADLVQWRSGASTLGRVDSTGNVFAVGAQLGPAPQTALAARLGITPSSLSEIVAIIRGAAGQTADLQQWQSNAGSVLARVDSTGAGTFAGVTTAGTVTGRLARWSSAAAGDVVVQVNGFAGQTGDLQQWRDSTGAVLGKVTSTGGGQFSGAVVNLTTGSQLGSSTNLMLPGSATQQALIAKGLASQSGDLQQWQNSAGTALASISAAGGVFGQTGAFGSSLVGGTQVTVKGAAASTLPLLVEGTTGQTQDLIQAWTTGSGPTVFQVAPSGFITTAGGITAAGSATVGGLYNKTLEAYPIGYATASSRVRITDDGTLGYYQSDHQVLFTPIASSDWAVRVDSSRAIANVPLTAKGAAGQTGDLQQWQNSSGTKLGWVTSDGTAVLPAVRANSPDVGYLNARLSVVANSSGEIGAVVRAAAGQTADLQQWQNSAGTVLAQLTANGSMLLPASGASFKSGNSTFAGVQTTNQWFTGTAFGDSAILQTGTLFVGDGTNFKPIKASAFTVSSARARKRNIRALEDPWSVLSRLRPVRYAFRDEPTKDRAGFIADEVAGVFPEAVSWDSSDRPDGVHYGEFVPLLVAGMQQLRRDVDALAA